MEYLVLRRKASGGLEGADVPVGVGGGSVEAIFQDLPPSEVRGLQQDENLLAATQPMPLALIEPVDSVPFTSPATPSASTIKDEPTWGVRAVKADTSGFTGKGVTVAVLDTGIDKKHEAFFGVSIVGRNFTQKSPTDKTIDPNAFEDTHGHGTHCAGTFFGRNVVGKRIGVAPGVTDVVIGKVLGYGGGTTGTLFTAMNWAIENRAHIISMSLGMDLVGFRERLVAEGVHVKEATSTAMRVLIDNVRFFDKFSNLLRSGTAFGRSAVVIAASGNESDRFGQRFGGSPFVLGAAYPAESEDFLSVGALEETGDSAHPFRVAGFSNAGARLAAPGVAVLSAAAGPDPKELKLDSGTSMATPHVAGVAALWAQKLMLAGQATAQRIIDKLRESALIPPGLDETDVGRGVPQAPQA